MFGGWKRLYRGETTINFFGRRNIGFIASGLLVIVTIVSLFAQGLNLGIDFKGGRSYVVRFDKDVETDELRASMKDVLGSSPEIKTYDTEDPETAVANNAQTHFL